MRRILTSVFGLLSFALIDGRPQAEAEESIAVKVVGKLRTGVVAIGGETTGFTITANRITWELDFGKNADLRTAAEKLDDKMVIVEGTLGRRAGVEKKERWIVTVRALKEAEPSKKETDGGAGRIGFRATPVRGDSRVRVIEERGALVLDVTSEFGIDRATVERLTDAWPKIVVVRLHLGGLESFRAGQGDLTIDWAMSPDAKAAARTTLWQGRKETPLTQESDYYTQGRVVGGDGKTPLQGGYFEVPLPSKLFAGNPREITLRWIDFYRN